MFLAAICAVTCGNITLSLGDDATTYQDAEASLREFFAVDRSDRKAEILAHIIRLLADELDRPAQPSALSEASLHAIAEKSREILAARYTESSEFFLDTNTEVTTHILSEYHAIAADNDRAPSYSINSRRLLADGLWYVEAVAYLAEGSKPSVDLEFPEGAEELEVFLFSSVPISVSSDEYGEKRVFEGGALRYDEFCRILDLGTVPVEIRDRLRPLRTMRRTRID